MNRTFEVIYYNRRGQKKSTTVTANVPSNQETSAKHYAFQAFNAKISDYDRVAKNGITEVTR